MIKAWRNQFETEAQKLEFDRFFEEFERFQQTFAPQLRETQGPLNQFLASQLILIRNEIKKLQKELSKDEQRRTT